MQVKTNIAVPPTLESIDRDLGKIAAQLREHLAGTAEKKDVSWTRCFELADKLLDARSKLMGTWVEYRWVE